MSDDKSKSDFASRLARIEQRQQTNQPARTKGARRDPVNKPAIRTAPNDHRLRNGVIWAAIFAVVGGGAWYGATGLASEYDWSMDGLSAGLNQVSTLLANAEPIGLVNDNREVSIRLLRETGWDLQSPAVATPDQTEASAETLVAGFRPIAADEAPGQIIPFDTNATCTLRAPAATEKVVNVRLEEGILDMPLQIFSKAELADRVSKNIEGLTTWNKPYLRDGRVGGDMKGVDVFVTDTSAPVYLVLQSLGAGVIWNVHPGVGVTIAHIAMIGEDSGLVAPPGDTPFEALRISDFVSDDGYGQDDVIRPCMVRPWRAPEADWTAMTNSQAGTTLLNGVELENDLYSNMMYTYRMGHAAFAAWYTATLGVDPDSNLTAVRAAAHVLAGPVPTTPVPYRLMAGHDIYLTRTDYYVGGTATQRAAQVDEIQNALMRAAAGGDIALLTPPAMEAAAQ